VQSNELKPGNGDVAIIGLSGRFPGAENIGSFWDIIRDGKETISYYTREELLEKGVDPELLNNPAYVRADGVVESAEGFDSSFFGYTPREADFMDPQQRVFIEECYSALENAGYDPEKYAGEIGLFGGCSSNRYWIKNLSQHHEVLNTLGELQTIINNDKDFLTTRVSYKLNLKGPSVNVQTACSTSLVAIHFACQSLVTHQCDMALSGGVHIKSPRREGYIFEVGSIDSATGHCRPFDKDADGTIFGEGVGVVILKRLEDAIHDRDSIIAVIKATSINNDGSLKVGYMAPGVTGQAKVISKAFDLAAIEPETVTYIETHGTGTKMGDPIEVEALRRVFPSSPKKKNYCALGSVKANIGHLDAAAGVTGLIKAALVLKNRKLPPLTNYTAPNPELDLENSPFYITRELKDWDTGDLPRRAAVSSFGIGGTNGHAILEEWIADTSVPSSKRFHLLPLSAKTDSALQRMYENLTAHLEQTNDNIADIAFTMQNGRKEFRNRGILVWDNSDSNDPVFSEFPYFKGTQKLSDPRTIFMFTGQGSQYINMARGLYEQFDSVKTIIDYADALLKANHNFDLLETIFRNDDENKEKINETSVAQPALFVVQYAVAHLLMEFGVKPYALTGHSIGELTSACLSGVFSFEDALNLVAWRGKLMQAQKPGSMLSVNLSKDQVVPLLNNDIELALVNAPNFCVISGSFEDIDLFEKKLSAAYPECRAIRLKTSHAFHSQYMEPAIEPFLKVLNSVEFGSVNIPFISNVTGTWITNEEAVNPEYWATHIRSTVNFSDGISELMKDENSIFIEVGPGNSLSMLLSQFQTKTQLTTISTLRHPKQASNDIGFFFKSLSGFWTEGGRINWEIIYADEERYRVPLPSYPFERRKHWIDPKIPYNYRLPSESARIQINQDLTYGPKSIEISDKSTDFYHNRPSLDNEFIAAESKIEKRIALIWEELLGIKGIGVTDNFFFLGGHSLLASQIINRINEEFRSEITIEKFFNFPTIRRLIEKCAFTEAVREEKSISSKLDYSSALPLSPSQERLWIINQIENNNPAYNISFSYTLKGPLNKGIFKKSLEILFDRHRVLRSFIRAEGGNPTVYINEKDEIHIGEIDFSHFTHEESDYKIQELLEKKSRESFDIENGPLYRIFLINLGVENTLFHFTVHHLIFDGWSWGIFTQELRIIYNDLLSDKKVSLGKLDLDYFEYSDQIKKEDFDIKHKTSKEYWGRKLEGISGLLNFPLDYERKEITSGEGGRVEFKLGRKRSEIVRKYSEQENVTIYMFLLSAFGLLISRYSGDQDICIGSPTANRPGAKLEKLIGLFINSIVLRLDINEELSFFDLLKKVKSLSIEALTYQELPFENLVDLIQPERVLNINPIFQVMFAWQSAPRPPLELIGIHPERVFQQNGVSPLDITLYGWEENRAIFGEFEFCTDILKRSTIESLTENFINLLDRLIENPEIPLKNISFISEEDQKKLSEFNSTDTPYEHNICIHQKFEMQVNENPDLPALLGNNQSISYKELNDHANRMANYLIIRGINIEDKVAICVDRSIEMMISILGILKAGAAYLPLSPENPAERLKSIINDANPKLILTSRDSSLNIPEGNQIVFVDDIIENPLSRNSSNPNLKISSKNLAYILYTSGSTGTPKGVMIEHHSVLNRIGWMQKAYPIGKTDSLLQKTPITFDVSVWELFWWFFNGAKLILLPKGGEKDPVTLIQYIDNYKITTIHFVPSMFSAFFETIRSRELGYKLESLNRIFLSGEALPLKLVKEFNELRESHSLPDLINLYGPTEATVDVSYYNCPRNNINNVYIGRPIDNTKLFVVNRNNIFQPIGVPGELLITGVNLARGYLNRPDLTNEKFFELKISNDHFIRAYRTGDLVKFTSEREIDYIGRLDNQIKIRGFRVELGEIESKILEHPLVTNCAVIAIDKGENQYLVAYVSLKQEDEIEADNLRNYLSGKLPDYMVPSYIVFIETLPLTSSGKLNRKNLPLPDRIIGRNIIISPSNKNEKILLGFWEDVLKIENICVNDNFFDIGGNSLLAIRVLNKIKEEFDITFSFKAFLTHSTIIQLSNYIDSNLECKDKSIELNHLTEKTNLPLSINQKRLWLISRLQPDIPSYILQVSYRLLGSVNIELFQKSLDILFQRHYIVFSIIKEINGEPYCDIVPSKVKISYIDNTGQPENEKGKLINELVSSDLSKPFNLGEGPLYRLYLVKNASDEYFFHLSIHHIIFDGWSIGVMVNDLSEIYNNLINGREAVLEELLFHQYDYAQWEAGIKDNKESIAFWEENMRGCSPVLNFPYDFPRKEQSTGRGSFEKVHLSVALSEKLRQISKEENSSLFTTMVSVFGILMQKYSGEDDLNIGLPVAYRPHSKLEKIFGMFVNTVVVRLRYEKGVTFRDLIKKANEAVLNAISHQDLPFEKVVEIVRPNRILNTNPLFQVAFDWQNNMDVSIKLEGIKSEKITWKDRVSIFDLTLNLWENDDIIEGEIEYNVDILKPETVIRLKDHLLSLINNLVENLDVPVSSVSIISDEERRMIIAINETQTDYPKDKTIVQLFETQTSLYPEKPAVVFKENSLTYKQLNEKTNQLARILRKSGVRANTPVGIMVDKSVDMIVGIFGILKAGGAYVPMDTESPEQRKNFIIRDSGCKVILMQHKYNIEPIEGIVTLSLDSLSSYDDDKLNVEGINVPSDLAYIIYTSGTTGIPKGTLIPHRGMVRLVCNTNYISFTPDDRVLQTHSIVFDSSVAEIFGALLNGATLYIVDKETLIDPDALGDVLAKNNITILDLASALFTQIAESRTDIFHKLKHLMIGGDVVSAPRVNKLRKEYPELAISNCYGPTENSCNSVAYKIDRDFDYNIPIGKPISNSKAYIFDKDLNHQPIGIIGELYVGGDGLSLGYLNREELNRISFISNPHNPGERLYKTGDLARWLPDWNIEFRGRADNQLKIRGFRVELDEIESVISEIDGVIETVVKPVKIGEGDYRLVAFLNVQETFILETNEIVRQIKVKLPAYMVPSAFKYMHGFPMNSSGKIDRKALNIDSSEFEKRERTDLTVLSPTEKTIHKIWCEALKTDDIFLKEDFFEIGGNSLLAIKLINKIREEFGIRLTFRELIANSTIGQLSVFIDSQTRGSEEAIELVHLTERQHLPLTHNQKRLWLISKLQSDVPSYIITSVHKFNGSLDRELFERSLDVLFQRHHIVFSVIKEANGKPYCEIALSKVKVTFIDYTGLPEKGKRKRLDNIFSSASSKAFDLEKGPLFRLNLIKTAADKYYFHMSIHHIIFDGWSDGIMVNDLSEIYNSLIRGKEVGLEELEFQQYDYAQWEAGTEDKKESIAFWSENMRDCSPVLNFPYDFSIKEKLTGRGDVETIRLTKAQSEKLKQISKEEGSSLFTTLMSCFGILMHKYSGEDDLNIGSPVVYRPHSKLENIFGMFVNTVVVRLKYEKGSTFRKIIHHTNKSAMNAIAHQDLTFEKIVEIVNPKRSFNVNPLFQVGFVWQNNLNLPMKLEGIKSKRLLVKERNSIFNIILYLLENGDIIEGEIEYSTDLLERETILRLKSNLLKLITDLVDNPDTVIESFSMISDEEKKMINTVNDTLTHFSEEKTIIQLFEERAVLNPENIALVFDNGELTYSDLNVKANHLAGVLQAHKIGTGDFVGLLLKRSPELIICLLAILKVGAAYVPLNLTDPENRVMAILNAAKINFVITNTDNGIVLNGNQKRLNIEELVSQSGDFQIIKNTVVKSIDPAYIIFTSGTTGIPKGVLVNNKSVINIIEWVNKTFNISHTDKLLWVTNLSFDLSVYDIFGMLAAGGAIRILSDDDRKDPKKQYELILNEGITFWDSAPQSLQQIAPFFDRKDNSSLFNSLRLVFLSGDWIPLSLPTDVCLVFPNSVVVGLGGATEATIWSNYFVIDKINPEWKSIPYGKPIQNARYYILDSKMEHCRIKQPGNLYIGGECLAMGYYNDTLLTNEKFIKDPFNEGSRLYLTGDKAQWMADGNIEFLGREDEQLKIRGYRVEMGEIKNVVMQNKKIKDAILIPDKSERHDIKVILFITTHDGGKLEVKNIKRELRNCLPDFMIPSEIIQYVEFPVTKNGKIDTKSLLSDYFKLVTDNDIIELSEKKFEEMASLSMTERIIYEIWSKTLKKKNISVIENFFDIGGNSLIAVSVFSEITSVFNVDLSLRNFFDNPRIKDLAESIDLALQKKEFQKSSEEKGDGNSKMIRGEI
jgi:tyrocidine synthetase-3